MAFEVLVLLIAASHVVTIALIILWFVLGKPLSFAEFWRRFRGEFLSWQPRR